MSSSIIAYSDTFRDEVLELWAEALPLDAITGEVLENRVLLDENFDPETFLLAYTDGKLHGFILGVYAKRMGLGDADPQGNRSWITALAVNPRVKMKDVGSRLIDEVESRFRSLGKRECYVSSYPPGYFTPGIDKVAYKSLLDLFLAHGYEAFHEAISMDASIVKFNLPEEIKAKQSEIKRKGIEIRPYCRSDLVGFMSFLEKSMPSDWVRVARRNLRKISEGGFRPDQITVAVKGSAIIGYCQFEGSHFGPFGVSDAHQGMGIGTLLLAKTLEQMHREGHHDAWVMWTDDVAAKVYAKFGFKETRRFVVLKKEL